MKKKSILDEFKAEHKVYRVRRKEDRGFGFFIDGTSYSVYYLYGDRSGKERKEPLGYGIWRKKRGERAEYLFDCLEGGESRRDKRYAKMYKELMKENPEAKEEEYLPYLVWHMIEDPIKELIEEYLGDMTPEEVKSVILDRIKYRERDVFDNMTGHSFKAPNGWTFKSETIPSGGFGNWPNGESLTVKDSSKKTIFMFDYTFQSDLFVYIIDPLYEIFFEILGGDDDNYRLKMIVSTEAAEYVYALKEVKKEKYFDALKK